ncbi:MucR family transcriptional regulator (plasmid) [Agrobacterium sp. rho-8.1]
MDRAVEILTAYLSNPTTRLDHKDIPEAYRNIRDVLKEGLGLAASEEDKGDLKPAVPIKKSFTDDHIVCLECGGKYKSLKRHLGQIHDMTTTEYKAKWSLSDDYPLVAKSYSQQRSELALKNNLGEQGRINRKRS